MPLDGLKTLEIIKIMETFLAKVRPPAEMRSQVDINYIIEGKSVIINEVRPRWDKKDVYREHAVAKATFNGSKQEWKIFWQRADSKWYTYSPEPTVKLLSQFTELVKEDEHHCFWG